LELTFSKQFYARKVAIHVFIFLHALIEQI
jgi:hypothetical protein